MAPPHGQKINPYSLPIQPLDASHSSYSESTVTGSSNIETKAILSDGHGVKPVLSMAWHHRKLSSYGEVVFKREE